MLIRGILGVLFVVALLSASPLVGQTPAPTSPDPGITSLRLIDRTEVRVSRITLEPGAVRRVHAHNEVRFQIFMVATGTVRLRMGESPIELGAGEVTYIAHGVPHGFENAGSDPAMVLEVFVMP